MSTKWFIADPHLGHEKVLIGSRKDHFPTIDVWNKHILNEMRKCGNGGELFILGDLSMEAVDKWKPKLPKSSFLIHGNHDGTVSKCARIFKDRFAQCREIFIGPDRAKCWLSHYAHAFWPASHHGSYHLYGHCHDQREATLDEWMPMRRSMDCSPETIFRTIGEWRPINEFEILEVLKDREGHDQLEFYHKLKEKFEN